jgi:hypothetical protein
MRGRTWRTIRRPLSAAKAIPKISGMNSAFSITCGATITDASKMAANVINQVLFRKNGKEEPHLTTCIITVAISKIKIIIE